VSNDIESELAKILARDNELRDAEASEKRKQEAAIAAAVIEWESRVEKVLLPAIEPLAAMLKDAGWTCDIERTPQGFKVAAFRGDMVIYGSRERPSLSLLRRAGRCRRRRSSVPQPAKMKTLAVARNKRCSE
jgi:hypothetical protein